MQWGTLFFVLKRDCFCFKYFEEQRTKMMKWYLSVFQRGIAGIAHIFFKSHNSGQHNAGQFRTISLCCLINSPCVELLRGELPPILISYRWQAPELNQNRIVADFWYRNLKSYRDETRDLHP